ncbi:MAG: nitroreductase [Bacteroidetes bacterium]|nr:nitroreductase [Bacteroidota bacterium]
MNETIKNIFNLKTTRSNNFGKDKISNENFDTIIKACVKAPNASNRQSYSIIVLDDKEKKELGLKGDKVLLFLVDFYRHECLKEYLGKNISFNHFQPFLTGVIDVSLAVQNAVIAANSLNIGYLTTNDTYTRDLDKIFDLFKLPNKGCFPLLYLCLGYPKNKTESQKSRIDIKHIVHHGEYNKCNQDEIISITNEYDNVELELFTKWKEKGYKTYLDWFYDKWLPSLEKQEKSLKLLDILKRIGFLN